MTGAVVIIIIRIVQFRYRLSLFNLRLSDYFSNWFDYRRSNLFAGLLYRLLRNWGILYYWLFYLRSIFPDDCFRFAFDLIGHCGNPCIAQGFPAMRSECFRFFP